MVAVAELFRVHVDPAGRCELVVAELPGGWFRFAVYRPGAVSSRYAVELPAGQAADLGTALVVRGYEAEADGGR